MRPVEKAIWYIESHFASDITLDDIASVAGVSKFYTTRAFGEATGRSVMLYVRGRRLSEAAKALAADGAAGILPVALDARYGSHEAFTRAFRDQFGATPDQVRANGLDRSIELVEPILMSQAVLTELKPPRLVTGPALLIAGLGQRYTCENSAGMPAQWQQVMPYLGHVDGQVGNVAYGVRCNSDADGSFEYICGVEVRDFSSLPAEFRHLRIPAHKYAVFHHEGHISGIRSTCVTIWSQWLPESRHEVADAPDFERYDERFDPKTGMGGLEIWIPIKS